MKQVKYVVLLPGEHVAKFSHPEHALQFARELSRVREWPSNSVFCLPTTIEVSAPDGLIGQFCDGRATPEFAHLDKCQHEWETDQNGLVDECRKCGELRA